MTDLEFEPLDLIDTFYEHQDWQDEAIKTITDSDKSFSADWSEMGCYKTTTALWLMKKRADDYRATTGKTPVSLIVTSKAGKGTYFDAIPKAKIPATVYTVGVEKVKQRIGDMEIPI